MPAQSIGGNMRSALSRADLLRVMAENERVAVDRIAAFCGLARQIEHIEIEIPMGPPTAYESPFFPVVEEPPTSADAQAKPPLQARMFQAWSKEIAAPNEPEPDLLPLTLAELQAPDGVKAPAKTPLLRSTQLWPALRQSVQTSTRHGLDVDALVDQLAQTQQLEPLPLQQHRQWSTPLWVIWQHAERLRPYHSDYLALYRALEKLRGSAGLELYTLRDDGSATHWRGEQGERLAALPKPNPGTCILLLSDLGALLNSPWQEQHWLKQFRAWKDAHVVAWLPSAPGQVHGALAQMAVLHHLTNNGLRRQRRGWRDSTQRALQHHIMEQAKQRLLVLASCALHVAPELLRALRLLDTALQNQPAAEALAWCADEVSCSRVSRPLRPEHAASLRAHFADLPIALQRRVQQCVTEQHNQRGRSTIWLEQLLWQAHCDQAALDPKSAAETAQARKAMQRLVTAGAGAELRDNIEQFSEDVVDRLQHDAKWWIQNGEWAAKLLTIAASDIAPEGLSAHNLLASKQNSSQRRCYLAQRGNGLWLMLSDHKLPGGQRLCADFLMDHLVLEVSNAKDRKPALFSAENAPCLLLGAIQNCTVLTRARRFEITEITRPTWAETFAHDQGGVYALTPEFAGKQAKFYVLPPESAHSQNPFLRIGQSERQIEFQRGSVTCRLGFDLAYGAFAEFQIKDAVQRLRWMAPGEFWMGSPEDEAERETNEGPRHRVRLTKGFWMADTACTQALWQAVTRKNPSHFKGILYRPVESISWKGAQTFVVKMAELGLSGVDLPTEAEWEYACRAGTQTPFSFGAQITTDQANYDGDLPYAGGARGLKRQRTLQVKALPANAWGLYQMHGNVDEWCKDETRTYRDVTELDPKGTQSKRGSRAVRGGAWFHDAGYSRSAFRNSYHPGYCSSDLGLRFVLRSTSTEAEPQGDQTAEPSN